MRITVLLLFVCTVQLSVVSSAQTITFQGKGNVLRKALNTIGEQTGYTVLYSQTALEMARPVNLNVRNMPLLQFLDSLLKGQPLKYMIEHKSIMITLKPESLPEDNPVSNTEKFTGLVTDSLNNPLANATIAVKGTLRHTLTDDNGRFIITASPQDLLLISYVGFYPKEVKLASEQSLKVVLQRLRGAMDDVEITVVNTGYQRLSKRELASSVVQVKMKDIRLDSRFSIDQMLAGQIPGLMSLQTSGEPGATPTLRIRGTSSIIGTKAPLWVLDGIILEDPITIDVSNINQPDVRYLIGNTIAGVNASDVETLTILKDASATALYGSRAANGVIVVTTKKGRPGPPQVSYSGSLSLSTRPFYRNFKLMNAGERMQLSREIIESKRTLNDPPQGLGYEGLYNKYLRKELTDDQLAESVRNMADRNTDWYKLLFRNALTNNQSVNVSGGTDRTTYYVSMGYTSAQGTARGSDQERYSSLLKLNSWISNRLYVGVQLNISRFTANGFHSSVNPNSYAYNTSRVIPVRNEDGSPFYYNRITKNDTAVVLSDDSYNILNEMDNTGLKSEVMALTAQLNVEYRLLRTLKYRFFAGYDHGNCTTSEWAKENSYQVSLKRGFVAGTIKPGMPGYDASVIPLGGILSNSDERRFSYVFRNTVEYNQQLNKVHVINAMFTQEIRSVRYKGLSQTLYGWQPEKGNIISPALTTAYRNNLDKLRPTVTDNINNNLSWIGSLSWSYKNKYTFNTNIRADGSNNFGNNPRYRFLPVWSVAAKYTLSNEPFLINSKVISYLAIRTSYGLQGNIDKNSSPHLIVRSGSQNPGTGLNESYYVYPSNPDLRWEKTNSVNAGLDFGISAGRDRMADIVSGTIEVYNKEGTDIIVNRNVSQVLGLATVKINGGRVRNRGIEASLNIVPYQTSVLSVVLRANTSYNKNTLVEANELIDYTDADKLNRNALIPGDPLGAFYTYRYAGLDNRFGYPLFYNAKGERKRVLPYSDGNLVYSGKTLPDITGGFGVQIRYKAWQGSIDLQYAAGGVDNLPGIFSGILTGAFDVLQNVPQNLTNRWRKPGDEKNTNIPVVADYQRFREALAALDPNADQISNDPMNMYDRSNFRTAKTDNIRLRSIGLNYMVQPDLLNKLGLRSLAFHLQAENIILIRNSAWLGRDPETGGANAPSPGVFSIGVNAGF